MRSFKRRSVSLRLLFFCMILGITAIYSLHLKNKAEHDAEVRSMQAKAGHAESDLERREREEKELGHSLWPYVQLLKEKALHPPSKEEILALAKKGMCTIDPYSKCFTAEEYKKYQQSLVSSSVGIGIVISKEKRGARIIDVRIKSPAEEAGISIGDLVTHVIVDKHKISLFGLTEEEQTARLSGDEGTTASLVLMRKGRVIMPPPIIRVMSVVPSVERVQLLAPHYGAVHIQQFVDKHTGRDLLYAIDLLKQKGDLHGFVIDLRGNLGGSFFESVDMAGFFLDGGLVTTTFRRTEGKKSYTAPLGDILRGVPIVILVDRNSASASEQFIGALCDRDIPRAILMGEKTYGKGVGQDFQTTPFGEIIKYTSLEFFSPLGNNINGKGFTPDPSLLEMFRDEHADDEWLGAALNYLRSEH
jgi:carboxyl-terminal processing protease